MKKLAIITVLLFVFFSVHGQIRIHGLMHFVVIQDTTTSGIPVDASFETVQYNQIAVFKQYSAVRPNQEIQVLGPLCFNEENVIDGKSGQVRFLRTSNQPVYLNGNLNTTIPSSGDFTLTYSYISGDFEWN